jgi:hypothetical protein
MRKSSRNAGDPSTTTRTLNTIRSSGPSHNELAAKGQVIHSN